MDIEPGFQAEIRDWLLDKMREIYKCPLIFLSESSQNQRVVQNYLTDQPYKVRIDIN